MSEQKPSYIMDLEAIYGSPSQKAFGTAVFFESIKTGDLKQRALDKYRYFVGELWDKYGEDAWLGPWKEVCARTLGETGDIVKELRTVSDRDARGSISMFLEVIENPENTYSALHNAFDDEEVTELLVYNIGDSGAMSGILIADWRKKTHEATFLFFLMD